MVESAACLVRFGTHPVAPGIHESRINSSVLRNRCLAGGAHQFDRRNSTELVPGHLCRLFGCGLALFWVIR